MSDDVAFPSWRLIPPERASGARQMALDQALLESAAEADFPPTLRFQRWEPAAVSIGRFQDISDIDLEACAGEGIQVVRRPTGGKCILHMGDFTYSVVLPSRFPISRNVVEAYTTLCRGILKAMSLLGLPAALQARDHEDYSKVKGACFAAVTEADLNLWGRKICGSAQVRRRGALLQHGTILLRDSSELLFRLLRFEREEQRKRALDDYREKCVTLEETDLHPGWDRVAQSMREGFGESFSVEIEDGKLLSGEEERCRALTPVYASGAWLINARSHELPNG